MQASSLRPSLQRGEKDSQLRPKDSANVQLGADSRFSTYWTRRKDPVLELRRVVVDDADSRAIGAEAVERDRVGQRVEDAHAADVANLGCIFRMKRVLVQRMQTTTRARGRDLLRGSTTGAA